MSNQNITKPNTIVYEPAKPKSVEADLMKAMKKVGVEHAVWTTRRGEK